MKQARIINDVAVDVVAGDPAALFTTDIAAQFVPVPDEVQPQWRRIDEVVNEALTGQKTWAGPYTRTVSFEVEVEGQPVTKWRYETSEPPPPPRIVQVPAKVTARQAVEALLRTGVTEAMVEASLAAIPDATQRAIAQNLWRRSNDFERNNPTLIALATQSLGMTEAQLDQLFILANTL